jgi:hypothetical protein
VSTENEKPLIGIVVEPERAVEKPKMVGIELSFYIGKRILIAFFATMILASSLTTLKASKHGADEILVLEIREEPNLILAAVALYLLGVSTDLDLSFPLKLIRGRTDSEEAHHK